MSTRKKYIEDNDLKMNMSTIFITPMLGFENNFLTDEFMSTYLVLDGDEPEIALVFENTDNYAFKDTIWILQQLDTFSSINYDDDDCEIIARFKIPELYKRDYTLIMDGKYSKISKGYKEVLLDYHGRKSGNGKCIYMIDALYPDHQTKAYRAEKLGVSVNLLPDGEVMSIPDKISEQYLRVDRLKSEVEITE